MIRPAFHHIAPGQWINDPVGLHRIGADWVLHDQRSTGTQDRMIGWGRATSPDLLTWHDEGLVIPGEADGWIYSGSVVSLNGEPRAFFTLHQPAVGLQAQAAARWDGQWRRTPGWLIGPKRNSRDPYVFKWRDEWRMLLAEPPPWDEPEAHQARLKLLASPDLESWTEIGCTAVEGRTGELFETPFLRRIPCPGVEAMHWPWLLAVGIVDRSDGGCRCLTRAWFGKFDGAQFEPIGTPFTLDHGPDFYAPALWAEEAGEEVVMTGWTSSWAYARLLPSEGWSGGAHALPRVLTAAREGENWALRQVPAALPDRATATPLPAGTFDIGGRALISITGEGTMRLGDLSLKLGEDQVVLERSSSDPRLGATGFEGAWNGPRAPGPLYWLLDGCVSELFSADGAFWLSALTLRGERDLLEIAPGLSVSASVIA